MSPFHVPFTVVLYVHTTLSDYVLPVLRVLCMHTGKCNDKTSDEAAQKWWHLSRHWTMCNMSVEWV